MLALFVLSGASAIAAAPSAAAPVTLVVGFFDLLPHATTARGGQAQGAAIDYFNLIAKEMGVSVRYTQLPMARLLLDPKVDMVLYMGKNPERLLKFDFPRQPLMKMEGGVAVDTNSPLTRIDTADDLLNLTIGVWDAGYRGALMRDTRLTLYSMPIEALAQRGLQMVVTKRLDGFYNPDIHSLRHQIKNLGLQDQVRVVSLPLAEDGLYSAFVKASAPRYLATFEKAYAKVNKKMSYEAFLAKYLAQEK
ncbi:substrate-binding periplasmic protein [Rhodoferax saidenbachensis]|uniref:substrate-binding periplasmic protein n=1 Tax=Rhodoferax saidenbachensis TaxID=1484693 RepID=UPI0004B06C88|nr:transporter substrate-binding domain-containing protein [Rhodoferax saidenbachensis]